MLICFEEHGETKSDASSETETHVSINLICFEVGSAIHKCGRPWSNLLLAQVVILLG